MSLARSQRRSAQLPVSARRKTAPSDGRDLLEVVEGSYPVGRECHASHWARCLIGRSIAARCSHRAGRIQPASAERAGFFPG
jgi:hypothetical protein